MVSDSSEPAGITIRDFVPEDPNDYEGVTACFNAVYGEYRRSVEETRYIDRSRAPHCRHHRWVAVEGGRIIALAEYDQWAFMYHPRKFIFDILVSPEHRARGIGRDLFDRLLKALDPFEPISVGTMAREDVARAVRFLVERGFTERMRSWESRIDPRELDYGRYAGVVESVRSKGIAIRTFRDVASADPEFMPKLHDLVWEIDQDVPHSEPATPVTLEQFAKWFEGNPTFIPDGILIALAGGVHVGTTGLWRTDVPGELTTGLTGVRRSHRRRGVALALKVLSLQWAKEKECRLIKTWNESNNRPMLSINEALGFVKQPSWIHFRKILRQE